MEEGARSVGVGGHKSGKERLAVRDGCETVTGHSHSLAQADSIPDPWVFLFIKVPDTFDFT